MRTGDSEGADPTGEHDEDQEQLGLGGRKGGAGAGAGGGGDAGFVVAGAAGLGIVVDSGGRIASKLAATQF